MPVKGTLTRTLELWIAAEAEALVLRRSRSGEVAPRLLERVRLGSFRGVESSNRRVNRSLLDPTIVILGCRRDLGPASMPVEGPSVSTGRRQPGVTGEDVVPVVVDDDVLVAASRLPMIVSFAMTRPTSPDPVGTPSPRLRESPFRPGCPDHVNRSPDTVTLEDEETWSLRKLWIVLHKSSGRQSPDGVAHTYGICDELVVPKGRYGYFASGD